MTNKIFYLIFFGLILAMSRIIPHPPNFTPILASAIMAPMLIKDRWFGMFIPVLAMFIADIIIGFHPYQLVIYLTIMTISMIAPMQKSFVWLSVFAVGSSVWFFITTNFAVWVAWDYYPKTINGLIECYTLAIPFFANTLISTCLFTGILAFLLKHVEIVNEKTSNIILVIMHRYRLHRYR